MQIIRDQVYLESLQNIMEYIAKNSVSRALIFSSELNEKLEKLHTFPYKYRKSIYFKNENIRDYIFRAYVIPYFIDADNKKIIILDIIKPELCNRITVNSVYACA